MLQSREGIIFRTVKYGETSVILDIFSAEEGLKSFIIGGVRKPKSKLGPVAQVLNIVSYEAYIKNSTKLDRIKDLQLAVVYRHLPFDVIKSSLALFLIEVCRKSLRESDENENVYDFIKNKLIQLDESDHIGLSHFHIVFLIELASLLGFEMENNYGSGHSFFNLRNGRFENQFNDMRFCLTESSSQILHEYLSKRTPQALKIEKRNLLEGILDFFRYHIDDFGELRSLEVIDTLYTDQ